MSQADVVTAILNQVGDMLLFLLPIIAISSVLKIIFDILFDVLFNITPRYRG